MASLDHNAQWISRVVWGVCIVIMVIVTMIASSSSLLSSSSVWLSSAIVGIMIFLVLCFEIYGYVWNEYIYISPAMKLMTKTSYQFLAATKQLNERYFLSVCPSVCPSVCLSHLFDYVPIIVSSWNFQELLPMTKVTSIQKVKVRDQRSRSQRSTPNLAVSGP